MVHCHQKERSQAYTYRPLLCAIATVTDVVIVPGLALFCLILSCLILSSLVFFFLVLSASCLILCALDMFCFVVSCLVVPCVASLVLSCLVSRCVSFLSCLVSFLSCLVLSRGSALVFKSMWSAWRRTVVLRTTDKSILPRLLQPQVLRMPAIN